MNQTKKKIQRQEKILSTLGDLTYATLEQIRVIENLGGTRNAHRILYEMEKDKLIKSTRMEYKVYYLSNRGKERIGKQSSTLKKSQIIHTLMRNDLYIQLGMPKDWKKEAPIEWEDNTLIPDARFTRNSVFHFVEIDHTQTMRTNYDKIKKYKELSSVIKQEYSHVPVVIWYTLSKVRKEKLEHACKKHRVKYQII